MSDLARVARLLESDRPETQIAAAIVLGELETKEPAAVKGLVALAQSPVEGLRLAAIGALEKIGSTKALPALVAALRGPQEVARAAAKAIAALGEAALPEVKAAMKDADPALQARLSEVVAQLGGKKGLGALLDSFREQDLESVARSAIAFRGEVRAADPRAKRALAAQIEKFLRTNRALPGEGRSAKRGADDARKTRASEAATVGALKLLGYLEDPATAKTLLAFTAPKKHPAVVRVEALIALRFALSHHRDAPDAVKALLPLAGDADARVARTALDTLGNLALPASAIPVFEKAALGADPDLARTAIARLAAMGGPAASALVDVALAAPPDRAKDALELLGDREEARQALLDAFLGAKKREEAERLAHLLRPHARRLGDAGKDALARAARAKVRKDLGEASAALALLREADPRRFAGVLRDEAERYREARKVDAARELYAALLRTDAATAEDRLALARIELMKSTLDLSPHARARDAALALYAEAARKGEPVAESLARVDLDRLFYVGFHLAELPEGEGREAGHELLAKVAQGKGKIAKLAKNKLKTSGYEG